MKSKISTPFLTPNFLSQLINFNLKFLGIFFLLNWLGVNSSFGQSIDINVMPEYASYKMSEMKTLQDEQAAIIYDSLGTYPKKMYDFPNYWGISVNSGYNKRRHRLDLSVFYNVTGGRLYYSDYSGLIKIDKQVTVTGIMTSYSFAMINSKRIQTFIGLGVGSSFSTLKEANTIAIYISDEETIQSNKYSSKQFFINPKIDFVFYPINNFFVKVSASYSNQVSSTSQEDKESGKEFKNKSGNSVTLDWTGFRIGAGIGYRFNLSK